MAIYRVNISYSFEIDAKDDVSAILKAKRYIEEGARDNESCEAYQRFRDAVEGECLARLPIRR